MTSTSAKVSIQKIWKAIKHDQTAVGGFICPALLAVFALILWWSPSSAEGLRDQQRQGEAGMMAFGALASACIGIPLLIYRIIETKSILSTGHLCEGVVDHIARWKEIIIIRYAYDGVEYRKSFLIGLDERNELKPGDETILVVNGSNPREAIYLGLTDL